MKGFMQRLHAEAIKRVGGAYAPKSRGPLNTGLRATADFAEQSAERDLFKEKGARGDGGAGSELTCILFAGWLTEEVLRRSDRESSAMKPQQSNHTAIRC